MYNDEQMKNKTYEELYDTETVNQLKISRSKNGKLNAKIYHIIKDNISIFIGSRIETIEFLY